MKKPLQLCLIAALTLSSFSGVSQTLGEADAADKRGEVKNAYAMYKTMAERGDAVAQFNMGFFSERGRGTQTDFDAAEAWYFKSASQGYTQAQANLGWLYTYQKKDVVRGAFWYEKAAAQQDANAIAALPVIYDANPGLKEKIKQYLDSEIEYKRQQALAQLQEQERKLQDEQTRKESLACLDKLYADPRTKSLSGKVIIDANKPASLEILANTAKPNPREKAALSYAFTEWERCTDIQEEPRKKMLIPEVAQVINAYRLDLKSAFADLYSGKTSYGDLAKTRARLDLDFKQKVSVIISNVQEKQLAEERRKQEAEAQKRYAEAQNQQQREAELARQREARRQLELDETRIRMAQQQAQQQQNNNFLQNMQLLQILKQQPQAQPRSNFPVNCTSTRLGSTVTTNCF